MTPGEVLRLLETRSVRLAIRDGFLRYRAPAGAYTDELRDLVAEHRDSIIKDWRCWQCQQIVMKLYGFHPILRCQECALEWYR